jgi:Peptidase family M23
LKGLETLPLPLLAWISLSIAQPAVQLTPLAADVLAAPQAVLGSDGAKHLLYEVRVENLTDQRFTLNKVEVLDDHGGILLQLNAEAIATRLSLGGHRGSESNALESYQFGVAFLHVKIPDGTPIPRSLLHLVAGYSARIGSDVSMRIAKTRVTSSEPTLLAAPLQGAGYVAADGCCDSIRHVRALLSLDGRFYLAQRFAVDWEKIDHAGRIFAGDPKLVQNYKIYGQPVFAVADGEVVAARTHLHDQPPGTLPQNLPLDEVDGNFAIIKLREGVYALYAHMAPNSVTVGTGARVHRGQQIGKVGNTGNTQAPHLHFQLMDRADALAANGLPYVFERYQVPAADLAGTEDFDRAELTGTPLTPTRYNPPIQGRQSLPLDLTIVTWGR